MLEITFLRPEKYDDKKLFLHFHISGLNIGVKYIFMKLIVGGAMVHEIYISENSGESILFLSGINKTNSRWGHGT